MSSNMRTSLIGSGQVISQPKSKDEENPASQEAAATSSADADLAKGREMANAIRFLAVDAVEKANSGHPGMPLGAADIITTLWTKFISFDPHNPDWIDRDRFILSAGHGSMLLYALLYLIGIDGVGIEDIKKFRQLGSCTPGHPERGSIPGIEVTTGPLGQGFAMAVGEAIAERQLNSLYGDDIIEHYSYVLASDGDLMEGISFEAASLAGHLKLNKMIVLYDSNNITIDGNTELSDSTNTALRFESLGWDIEEVDGHDNNKIEQAISNAQKSEKPSLIICKTKIGYGAPTKEGKAASHGAPLGKEEIASLRKALNWEHPPFEIPGNLLDDWRIAGLKMAKKRAGWQQKWGKLDNNIKNEITRRFDNNLPDGILRALNACKRKLGKERSIATRKASGAVIETLAEMLPELIGGSADLTGSNNTKAESQNIFDGQNYNGNYIHYGVREHAMAAMLNGMAAHGGMLPYGGTFLIFSDYCKPSVRLAALMGLRNIFIFTHDSIGLGEDGPTHQPIEHLASLRSIPNLNVFRPADAVETVECWDLMLKSKNTPSALLLSRQDLPVVRNAQGEENRSQRGAYELRGVDGNEDLTLIASGSEVALALAVRRRLNNKRIAARVVSVPCLDLFASQSLEFRNSILGNNTLRVVIEAAGNSNWHDVTGDGCHFIGMNSFGASGSTESVFNHFGFNEEVIADKVFEFVQRSKQKEKERSLNAGSN